MPTGLDKAIIVGRSMNNAVAIAIAEDGEVDIEKIEEYARGLTDLELELYEHYGAGGPAGGDTPSGKKSWGGSKKSSGQSKSSGDLGPRPSNAQRNWLNRIGHGDDEIAGMTFKEWKGILDAQPKRR